MDKYYVIVAGSGSTSRANLEALMEDHFYAHGADGVVVLPYEIKPSQGQVFAAQLAKDKNKELIVYTKSGKFEGLPTSTMVEGLAKDAANDFKKEKSFAFLLWDDEDPNSVNLLADLDGIPCFDLTDGLKSMSSADVTRMEAPVIPEQETIKVEAEQVEDEEDDEEEDLSEEEDLDEADEEIMENLYYGVQAIAQIFAQALIEAMEDAPNKPLKGPEA